jgi:hypothetical protein
MPGRTMILPMLAAGLLLVGCDAGGITDPAITTGHEPQAIVGARPHTMVPIEWTYHMAPAPGGEITCSNSDGSPPFLTFPINWKASGMMSHLGTTDSGASAAWFSSCVVNIVGGVPVSGVGYGYVHIVGANGDAIDLAGALTLDFTSFEATGDWTITGGTGRFASASGWIQTLEVPAADGSGSDGSGSGMVTPPGMLNH